MRLRPKRMEPCKMRVKASVAYRVAAGRRKGRPAEARKQGAGKKKRRPDLRGELRVDARRRHARRMQRDRPGPAVAYDLRAETRCGREHRIDVRDVRHVFESDRRRRKERRRYHRKRGVLVPGDAVNAADGPLPAYQQTGHLAREHPFSGRRPCGLCRGGRTFRRTISCRPRHMRGRRLREGWFPDPSR